MITSMTQTQVTPAGPEDRPGDSAPRQQRAALYWGAAMAGPGLGTCLNWAIHIYQAGNARPVLTSDGAEGSLYPNTALTVLIVFAASLALTFGLAAIGAAVAGVRLDPGRKLLYWLDGPPAERPHP
jgi:hypothetical protein